jgi:hypothetical protein
MAGKTALIKQETIQNRIFAIRGCQVMLDSHLADLYGSEIRRLNEQVKRNIERFPKEFMFRLTEDEYEFLRSQNVTLKKETDSLRSQNAILDDKRGKHRKYLPYVFTEQGVAMLSAVLRSEMAIKVSIQIMEAFVEMRKFIAENAIIFQRLAYIERRQLEADKNFEHIFDALQSKDIEPKQGVFYDGQVFDAYTFISSIIRKAKTSIILIDNYVDDTVLSLFTKRKKGVAVTIYTRNISQQIALDIEKHNTQYEPIIVKEFKVAHDRFLIIDEKELYHIGASLKDLGKKWFAFSKMDKETLLMLNKLKVSVSA